MHISTVGFITSLVFGSTLTRKLGVTMKDRSNMSDGTTVGELLGVNVK